MLILKMVFSYTCENLFFWFCFLSVSPVGDMDQGTSTSLKSFQYLSAAGKSKPKGHTRQSFQTSAIELSHGSSFPLSVLKPPMEKVLILTHQAMNREKRLIASD